MAQTPVSVSVNISGGNSTAATTLYTVPVGKTAIVKGISAVSAAGGGPAIFISKSISGQSYPIVYAQNSTYTAATGATGLNQYNLLPEPLTMAAGEVLQGSTDTTGSYVIPSVSTAPTTAADGTTATILQIVYGNSIYMAVGYSSTGAYVATSPDCITWTQRTSASPLAGRFTSVAYANGVWVAIYSNFSSTVFYSTDNGVNWSVANAFSGLAPVQVWGGNNQIVVSTSTGRIYYSTNGSAWTQFTAMYSNTQGLAIRGGGWTGSHWIFSTQYGTIATTNLSTALYHGGINNGQNITNYRSIEYSPAYGKYYATRFQTSVLNIFSSSEGLTWTNLSTFTGFAPYKVVCAGSNPILIVHPGTSSTNRGVSTNGTTFSSTSDVRGYTGLVFGLENGYYLTFQDTSQDNYYVSTDPINLTGTASSAGQSFTAVAAAADPITGKWCAIGRDTGSMAWVALGGSNATNCNFSVQIGVPIDSTYGNPVSMCWSAADGYFYALSDTGQVWRATSYNGGWSQVATSVGTSGYNNGYSWNIRAVGTNLYVTNGNQSTYIYMGSTLNGGTSWTTSQVTAVNSGYYNPNSTIRSDNYLEGNGTTNGSYYLLMSTYGYCTIYNPAGVRSNPVSPPTGGGNVQTLNGYTFMYGGLNRSTNTQGVYWSSNIMTTYGSYYSFTNQPIGFPQKPAMYMTYVNGTYYVNNVDGSSYVFNSSNLSTWGYKGIGVSMCGIPVVNISGGFANDGTNFVSWTTGGNPSNITKTSTPSNYAYAATLTASVIEIS